MTPLLSMQNVNRVLCIGAHPDDIELGMGSTLMRLMADNPAMDIHWLTFCGANETRAKEAQLSAAAFQAQGGNITLQLHAFKDAFLPWQGEQVKSVFEATKQMFEPDLIFTHYEKDRHQDHRLLSELTWNTWRNHAILEYEILKWDGDLGQPNVYVPVESRAAQKKVANVFDAYPSQHSRAWFSQDNFLALMRIRSVECNSEFAEAFYARKITL